MGFSEMTRLEVRVCVCNYIRIYTSFYMQILYMPIYVSGWRDEGMVGWMDGWMDR